MKKFLTTPHLSSMPWLSHGFSTRFGGSAGDVASFFAVPVTKICALRQIHSATAHVVDQPSLDVMEGDALVTKVPGLVLNVKTADCGPILLADSNNRVIGAAHAGWRGALGGIIESTIDKMLGEGADTSHITACLGPCIRKPSYEVSAGFFDEFIKSDKNNHIFFEPSERNGHHMFDLAGYIKSRLGKAGIKAVHDIPEDTLAGEDLFLSHRRSTLRNETRVGNQLSGIMIKEG